jgi:hypothetical protein
MFKKPLAVHWQREERLYRGVSSPPEGKAIFIDWSPEKILDDFSQKEPFSDCSVLAKNFMDDEELEKDGRYFLDVKEQARRGRVF